MGLGEGVWLPCHRKCLLSKSFKVGSPPLSSGHQLTGLCDVMQSTCLSQSCLLLQSLTCHSQRPLRC